MTKRVDIPMSLLEMGLVLGAIDSMKGVWQLDRLAEILEERKMQLEEDMELSRMHNVDADGYESLTDYGKRAMNDRCGDIARKKDE